MSFKAFFQHVVTGVKTVLEAPPVIKTDVKDIISELDEIVQNSGPGKHPDTSALQDKVEKLIVDLRANIPAIKS